MEYVKNRQFILPKTAAIGLALLCLSSVASATNWANESKQCQSEETESEIGQCTTDTIDDWLAEAELREEVIVYGRGYSRRVNDEYGALIFDESINGWRTWKGVVAYAIQSEPEEEEDDPVKEKEQCLVDVQLEFDICRQKAFHTHLMQYRACEAVHWSGWFISFASRGRFGSVPDTCGTKLEINRDLNFARCTTNNTVNKILCE